MSEHDRHVLEASKALAVANAGGDVQKIRAAMAQVEAALRGEPPARPAPVSEPNRPETPAAPAQGATQLIAPGEIGAESAERAQGASAPDGTPQPAPEAPAAAPKPPSKPVIAVRGDDRPGVRKAEAGSAAGRGGKFGDRRDARGPDGPGARGDDRGGRFGDRPVREERGPRLGDAAFRAQRDALEHAELALRKLAAQAHGEALTHLLAAWEQRDAALLPSVQELGRAVTAAVRTGWSQALAAAPSGQAAEALLRLEIAAELPASAEQIDARRALQLQLLTRRGEPGPAQTWGQDAATVLGTAHDAASARRLQAALKALLRK